ncbi:MAG: hypothetical protein AAGC64_07880 [Bacteroidota bacterium]
MMVKLSKKSVLKACKSVLAEKISAIQFEIENLKEAAQQETKSSMGDKYETVREIMMQEQSKLTDRLELLFNQVKILESIELKKHTKIKLGSLVETDEAFFFISVALGMKEIEKKKVFFVSPLAPLVIKMIGKSKRESFVFNGKKHTILSVD